MEDYSDNEAHSSANPYVNLIFPTLQLHNFPANSADNHPNGMRPPPPSRTPSEAASSGLDDSVYDIVSVGEASEGGLLSDDEDARTESLASVDGRQTPDDVLSTEDEDEEREYGVDSLANPTSDLGTHHDALVDVYPSVDDSGYSARTARPESSVGQSDLYIDFEEEPSDSHATGESQLIHVFQTTDEDNMASELSVYGSSHVGLSMHVTISNNIPKRKPAFRLLVASYHEHLVHEAATHIKAALDFAGNLGPTYTNIDLIVERCRGAHFARDRRTIQLDVEGCGPLRTAPGGLVGPTGQHPTPDLAVFLHPSLAHVPAHSVEQMEETFARTRDAMLRCNVPILDLSEYHPLFQAQPMSYLCGKQSLYLQVEIGQKDEKAIVEQLPVDLDKFLAMDPHILGLHLACIVPGKEFAAAIPRSLTQRTIAAAKSLYTSSRQSACTARVIVGKWVQPVTNNLPQWATNLSQAILALAMFALMASVFMPPNILPLSFKTTLEGDLHHISNLTSMASTKSTTIPPLSTFSAVVPVVTKAALPAPLPDTKAEISMKSLGKLLTQPEVATKPSLLYSIDVVGDNHIVLTPLSGIKQGRIGQIQFNVTRSAEVLKSQVTRLSSGAYVIELDREQAHGQVEIVISCRINRQNHLQTLAADLGSPWLKASTWGWAADTVKQVVHDDLAAAQASAQEISIRMTTSLQRYAEDFSKRGKKISKDVLHLEDEIRKTFLQISTETALTPWRAIQNMRHSPKVEDAKSRHISRQSNSVSIQIGTGVRIAQQAAMARYQDAMGVLLSMDPRKMLPKKISNLPTKSLVRGQRNAKDLLSRFRLRGKVGPKACAGKKAKSQPIGGRFGRGKKAGKE